MPFVTAAILPELVRAGYSERNPARAGGWLVLPRLAHASDRRSSPNFRPLTKGVKRQHFKREPVGAFVA